MFSMGSNMGGVTSPLLMQAGDTNTSGQQPAMAFTYVPVPVYNLGGMGMGMPMMPGKSLILKHSQQYVTE